MPANYCKILRVFQSLITVFLIIFVVLNVESASIKANCKQLFANQERTSVEEILETHVADQVLNTRDYKSSGYPTAETNVLFPYWIIPRSSKNIIQIGDPSSIFVGDKQILVVTDYNEGAGKLTRIFGKPSGELLGHRHSSIRTVTFSPKMLKNPIILKFPANWLGKWLGEDKKKLSPKDIMRATEATSLLKDSGLILPEPGGINIVTGNKRESKYSFLVKNTLFDLDYDFSKGDRPLVLHSLLKALKKTSSIPWLKGEKKNSKKLNKLRSSILSNLASLIIKGIFNHGVHFTPHQQNIELILSTNLQLKLFLVKDLGSTTVDINIANKLELPAQSTKFLDRIETREREDDSIKSWYEDVWGNDRYDLYREGFRSEVYLKKYLLHWFEQWLIDIRRPDLVGDLKLSEKANQPLPPNGEPNQLVINWPIEVQQAHKDFIMASQFINDLRYYVLENF